jgi:predicted phosphodiesterase
MCSSSKSVLNFIHLSDIHFGDNELGKQFDRDAPLRAALLDSLKIRPEGCDVFDGVLVSGDVAYSGHKKEYERAEEWLGNVCKWGGCDREAIYVVPGNHDVNRKLVKKNNIVWSAHHLVRECSDNEKRHKVLQAQLTDEIVDALLPLNEFSEFAARYGCQSHRRQLSWHQELDHRLSDGTRVILHGLNSAVISDEDDAPSNLFVSGFQLGELLPSPDVVRVVLCHHPPAWLCDRVELLDNLLTTSLVHLFGHEHNARVHRLENSVQVFSGAVHPERNEPNWKPCYHLLQLSIVNKDDQRFLRVRVFTKAWNQASHAFLNEPHENEAPFREEFLPLPPWKTTATAEKKTSRPTASDEIYSCGQMAAQEASATTASAHTARRQLVVHFFGLGVPLRYAVTSELGLWREGDDKFKGQEMWMQILKRAEAEGNLADLWEAVAKQDPEFRKLANPFKA